MDRMRKITKFELKNNFELIKSRGGYFRVHWVYLIIRSHGAKEVCAYHCTVEYYTPLYNVPMCLLYKPTLEMGMLDHGFSRLVQLLFIIHHTHINNYCPWTPHSALHTCTAELTPYCPRLECLFFEFPPPPPPVTCPLPPPCPPFTLCGGVMPGCIPIPGPLAPPIKL